MSALGQSGPRDANCQWQTIRHVGRLLAQRSASRLVLVNFAALALYLAQVDEIVAIDGVIARAEQRLDRAVEFRNLVGLLQRGEIRAALLRPAGLSRWQAGREAAGET